MKQKLFFIATLFIAVISFSSFSGGKCKFDHDKKDDFSGKSVRWTKYSLYFNNSFRNATLCSYEFQLGDNSGQFNIQTNIMVGGETKMVITNTDTTLLKLENGKIIKIAANGDFTPSSSLVSNNVITEYKPLYNISKAKMEKLAESPIVAIKVKIGDQTYTVKPKESKAAKLMETAACLISEQQ